MFEEFDKCTKEQWIEQATKDLKGENVLEKFSWAIEPGINIQPYYSQEDIDTLDVVKSHENTTADLDNPEGEIRVWENRVEIDALNEKEANQEALKALNQGADGILFNLTNEQVDLNILLNDILLNYCAVSFEINIDPVIFTKNYVDYLDAQDYIKSDINGSFVVNELTNKTSAELIQLTQDYVNLRPLTILISNGNYSEQICDSLIKITQLIDYLTDNGINAKLAFTSICVAVNIGNDFFAEIAKLKALRITLIQLMSAYDISAPNKIIAIINNYTEDKYAPHSNMLKGPTAAMSAILGGCDSLLVMPENKSSELEIRVARNVSNILKEESYLNKVADPAAGSYFISNLTDQLANKAWNNFKLRIKEL